MTESICHPPTTQRRRIDWLLTLSAIAITLLYVLYWQFAHTISGTLHIDAHAAFELTNTIWWGVLLGIVMTAILGRIPREFVMSALGTKTGVRGVFRAALAGLLLDLCNHGVLMVGSRLYERGASKCIHLHSSWFVMSLCHKDALRIELLQHVDAIFNKSGFIGDRRLFSHAV